MSPESVLPRQANAQKRTRRGPHTRKQILDVSLRLISERGFARTTVRDIARKAGITDAAIYYHFQSKREILEALVEERGFVAGRRAPCRVAAAARPDDEGRPRLAAAPGFRLPDTARRAEVIDSADVD